MYAAISPSEPAAEAAPAPARLQRTSGRLHADFIRDGEGRSRLQTLYQEGAFKARLPVVPGQRAAQLVLLNTAGGLTGGDAMTARIKLGEGATADITTQASEKIYRSTGDDVVVDTHVDLAAGAAAYWLPQETILFDRARLRRSLTVTMADDAKLLAVEAVVFGRTAMGERVQDGLFVDQWRVRRGGRLVFADATRLVEPVHATLTRAAVTNGGVAIATVVCTLDNAEARLDAVRDVLAGADCDAGASAFDGLLVARFVAETGDRLRRVLVPVLELLRDGRPLPRPWFC